MKRKKNRKRKSKIQEDIHEGRKPRRLSKLVVKNQNNKWKS
jgi:hypothetical protein